MGKHEMVCGECKKDLPGKPNEYTEIEVDEGKKKLFCVDCTDGWIKAQQDLNNAIGTRIAEYLEEGEATGNLLEDVEQAMANLGGGMTPEEDPGIGQIRTIVQGELAKIDAGAEIDPEDTFLTIIAIVSGHTDDHNEDEEVEGA